MKSTVTIVTTTLAFVISISTICSTHASPNEVYPQQNNHLRTQSRLNSKHEAIVRSDEETEVSNRRKLQPDNEDEVADLLEEVVDLLKETDTPTYSPTKPETEEPTSGMPTYSPTCEDDDCGKKDTPAPVAPDIVETTPPVPTPIITDPPVKEVEEEVTDPVDDTTDETTTDETTTDESDTTDEGGDNLNVSGAEGTETNKSNSLSGGATAGIVIGALAVAGLAAAGIVMAKKRRDAIPSSEDTQDLNSGFVETELVPPPPPPPPSALDSIMKKKQGAADENEEVDLARSTSISWKPQPDIEQVQSESEF